MNEKWWLYNFGCFCLGEMNPSQSIIICEFFKYIIPYISISLIQLPLASRRCETIDQSSQLSSYISFSVYSYIYNGAQRRVPAAGVLYPDDFHYAEMPFLTALLYI